MIKTKLKEGFETWFHCVPPMEIKTDGMGQNKRLPDIQNTTVIAQLQNKKKQKKKIAREKSMTNIKRRKITMAKSSKTTPVGFGSIRAA